MKAIILAAGTGTRLKDLTEEIPKCLIKIDNKTLLERQLEIFKKQGINNICIVVGAKELCWNEESYNKIKSMVGDNIVYNPENDKTENTYSLKLGLEKTNKEDVLIIDGDLAFSEDLIKNIINHPNNLILSKECLDKQDPNNRIMINNDGKVLNIKRGFSDSDLIYGALVKIRKENFSVLKELINKNKYYNLDLGFLLDELCNKIEIHNINNNNWINVNTLEDLKMAEKLIQKNFVILMFGYTAVGKSTIAQKIAKILNAESFHSAVVRKELGLTPKNTEEADKFFDYRNNLRRKVDEKVYRKIAEDLENALKNKKNVVLDAGYFFNWQRKLIYEKLKSFNVDFFIIKVQCKNKEEIKRRLKERKEKFGNSPFNEAPSWNTYVATKMVSEPIEKDDFPEINIIEYDSFSKKIKNKSNSDSKNLKTIIKSLRKI